MLPQCRFQDFEWLYGCTMVAFEETCGFVSMFDFQLDAVRGSRVKASWKIWTTSCRFDCLTAWCLILGHGGDQYHLAPDMKWNEMNTLLLISHQRNQLRTHESQLWYYMIHHHTIYTWYDMFLLFAFFQDTLFFSCQNGALFQDIELHIFLPKEHRRGPQPLRTGRKGASLRDGPRGGAAGGQSTGGGARFGLGHFWWIQNMVFSWILSWIVERYHLMMFETILLYIQFYIVTLCYLYGSFRCCLLAM